MRRALLLIITAFLLTNLSAQEKNQDNLLVILGDSLVGNVIDGERLREFISNVVITHGDVRITCDRALQNLTRNEVDLIGNVVVTQDSVILKTSRGKYYGNDKVARSNSEVDLTDGHINLKSNTGYYYFEDKRAEFYGTVSLRDSVSNLVSDKLVYFNDEDRTVAVGRVIVRDTATSILYADSLIHLRNEQLLNAYGRVKAMDTAQNTSIFGSELFDDRNNNYRKITGNPLFMQIDTTSSGNLDTLFITSIIMEQVSDSVSKFIAKDSVKILRGSFSSVNNHSVLFRDEGKLITFRQENEVRPPVLWYNNSQLSGDSVYIYLRNNELDLIDIRNNSLIVSEIEDFDFRFDQISGNNLLMNFDGDELNSVEIEGNVLSIYYYMTENTANGLLKSSSKEAVLKFDNNEVTDVRLYGSPLSEYHPESVLKGMERDFTIPTFIVYDGRPAKEFFINKLPPKLFYKRGM